MAYELDPNVIRYVAKAIRSLPRFANDRMTLDLLSDVETCDGGKELMTIAVNVCLMDEGDLCELILHGDRTQYDLDDPYRPPLDMWDGRNDRLRQFVSGYYVVS